MEAVERAANGSSWTSAKGSVEEKGSEVVGVWTDGCVLNGSTPKGLTPLHIGYEEEGTVRAGKLGERREGRHPSPGSSPCHRQKDRRKTGPDH